MGSKHGKNSKAYSRLEQSSCESIIGRAEVDAVLDAKRAAQQLRKQDAGGGEGAEGDDEVVE
eukprot:1418200-Rhodomonas_salina.1